MLGRLVPAFLAALLGLTACDEPEGDYVAITGGGFIFNYRIGEAHYGLVAEARRDLPEGAVVRAEFEDPAGGPRIVEEQKVRAGQRRFVLDTPPVRGVEADAPYEVVLAVVSPDGTAILETHRRTFRSNVSQALLPDAPLTIGPGYARNPAASAN